MKRLRLLPWDGSDWTLRATIGPSARSGVSLAYDTGHSRAVLFGGLNPTDYQADTWLWDGTTWTQASPAASPTKRNNACLAYDSARGRTVLYGGTTGSFESAFDTWEWNGTNWTQVSTTAVVAPATAMAFDPVRSRTVLVAGWSGDFDLVGDTWEWDGASWTQRNFAGPSSRFDVMLAYDANRGRTVMFGDHEASRSACPRCFATRLSSFPSTCPPSASPMLPLFEQARCLRLHHRTQGRVDAQIVPGKKGRRPAA